MKKIVKGYEMKFIQTKSFGFSSDQTCNEFRIVETKPKRNIYF